MTHGIAVMAKYPATHPRYQVCPEWHAWGGQVFATNDPNLERLIEQTSEVARRTGCSVRVQRQPLPKTTEETTCP